MTYEVEVKYPLADEAGLRELLALQQAVYLDQIFQEDEYLNHPSRDFAQTDEALRIRRIGQENRVTYKGPLVDRETKTREEIELNFAEGDAAALQFRTMLQKLGFVPVYRVRKQRERFQLTFSGREFEVVIDNVEGLGKYVELECAADAESQPAARKDILELAARLRLGPEMERRSYLRLLLAKQPPLSAGNAS